MEDYSENPAPSESSAANHDFGRGPPSGISPLPQNPRLCHRAFLLHGALAVRPRTAGPKLAPPTPAGAPPPTPSCFFFSGGVLGAAQSFSHQHNGKRTDSRTQSLQRLRAQNQPLGWRAPAVGGEPLRAGVASRRRQSRPGRESYMHLDESWPIFRRAPNPCWRDFGGRGFFPNNLITRWRRERRTEHHCRQQQLRNARGRALEMHVSRTIDQARDCCFSPGSPNLFYFLERFARQE